MENKESNILIAEFMGYSQPHPDYPNSTYWYKENKDPLVYLSFHSDWNWLMKVVEKIYKTDLYYSKYIDFNSSMFTNGKIEITTDIENLYNDCIEFIKWFNNENK